MVRKILAALDGSKTSESILRYLDAILTTLDANVTLVTVTPRENPAARAYLDGVAAGLRDKGAYVDVALPTGEPAAGIVALAVRGGYDLVALCTRGKTGLRRLVLGSVAEEVLRRLPVPALVVHPVFPEAPPPTIRRILVPLDGSHRSASVLPVAAELAKTWGAKVDFVTVVSPTQKEELPVELASHNLAREQKALQQQGLEVDLAILYGDPATEILGFAEAKKSDLLALSTHGRTGLDRLFYGSVAETLLRRGTLPLLVLRTAAIPRAHSAVKAHRDLADVAKRTGEPPQSKSPY
jgi:nucleotide-binding universal stress UspA family protein